MLDQSVLEQIARSQAGDGVRIWRHDREPISPMNAVLDVVDTMVSHPYSIFWVSGGAPETFSLPDLDPAVVLFSTRHLEMMGQLRGILTTFWLDGPMLEAVAEQVSLRILAELTLRQGDPALACHLMAESLSRTTVDFPRMTLMGLEREPISESYLSVWFYGLLHEMGHVAARERDHTRRGGPDTYLGSLADAVLGKYFGDHSEAVRKRRAELERIDALDSAVLTAEIDADLFSVQALFEGTYRVFERSGTLDQLNAGRLASDVLLMFGLFHVLNSCALAVRLRDGADAADLYGNVANAVRLNVIIDFLAELLTRTGTSEPGEEDVAGMRQKLVAAHDRINARFTTFDRGHALALRLCLFPHERRLDAIGGLAAFLDKQFSSAVAGPDIRHFLALADSLDISHPDLDLLVELASTPGSAKELLADRQRIFLLPWVSGDGVDMPFLLPGRDKQVAFVFGDDEVARVFVEESRSMLAPNLELTSRVVVSPTEQNVVITVALSVPEGVRDQLRVVFEGTPEFGEQFERLADGSFWPD
ncbi:hypothetical protein [Paractinoplanes lichenicola]|uniref:Uncharacterized protein n=1 Tax=Paractinoplanes lichenicola TaxID=2802976 RepID=A0ABS1VXS7_9ACTN|nr:hypothetical protein [Actinoplanes lichenicola]MBL7259301.1 hypothetical protein [Actinoplanes lichenicola]